MNIGETLTALKPIAGGAVVGAAALAIVAFSADWVVTTGTMQQQVRQAKVTALAQVCETNALAHWKQQGKTVKALEGWGNEKREKLAKQFAPALANPKDSSDAIVDACDDMLRPA